jgi:ubiquinone/menaquinone biosynthesis C-methylase UbiE
MTPHKFNPERLAMLDDPERLDALRPDQMWRALGSPEAAAIIIEIGAGTGGLAAQFAALAPDAVIYAADIEPGMLQWMRDKHPEVPAGRIVPVLSEENHVPCGDALADIVYMVTLHHELVDPRAMYTEALRLLKPGGVLLVADWAPRRTPGGPPLHVRVSAGEVTELLEAAGFEDVTEHPELPWTWLLTARRSGHLPATA